MIPAYVYRAQLYFYSIRGGQVLPDTMQTRERLGFDPGQRGPFQSRYLDR